MKKRFLLLLLPFLLNAQTGPDPNDILDRLSMIDFMVNSPGGQMVYRQTKNWCTEFLVFNEQQSEIMDELFNTQFLDISHAYRSYLKSHAPSDLNQLISIFARQEAYFRKLLTPEQLQSYRNRFAETYARRGEERHKAFHSLFISDQKLAQYSDQ